MSSPIQFITKPSIYKFNNQYIYTFKTRSMLNKFILFNKQPSMKYIHSTDQKHSHLSTMLQQDKKNSHSYNATYLKQIQIYMTTTYIQSILMSINHAYTRIQSKNLIVIIVFMIMQHIIPNAIHHQIQPQSNHTM